MPTFHGEDKYIFEYQTPATLDQAAPVQNTWYTILPTTSNVLIHHIATNIEDTNETVEIQITIDGETITGSVAQTHSDNYYWFWAADAISQTDVMESSNDIRYATNQVIQGKSIKIEARKTTAAGVGNLTGIVIYGVLKHA